ncbi:hypothetical protein DXG01_002198 [Tephrocybe rancida]|nr:hypothetical protein DXG01_002198 [Tephrocybe rancida]
MWPLNDVELLNKTMDGHCDKIKWWFRNNYENALGTQGDLHQSNIVLASLVCPPKKCHIHKVIEKYQMMPCKKMRDLMRPWVVKYHKKYGTASLELLEAQVAEEDWEELENSEEVGENGEDATQEEEMDLCVDGAEQAKVKQIKTTKHFKSWMLKARNKVAKRAWQEESQEVKERVLQAIEEEKKEMLAMLDMEKEGLERNPEQWQLVITNLVSLLENTCHEIYSLAGWSTTVVTGGPNPAVNDEITMQTVSYGETVATAESFYKWYSQYDKNITLVNTTEPVPVIQLIHAPAIPSPSPPTPALPTILPTSFPSSVNLETEGVFNFPQHLFSDTTTPTPLPLTGTWPTTIGPQLFLSSPWWTLSPQAPFPVTASINNPVSAMPTSITLPIGGAPILSHSNRNPGILTTSIPSTPPPVTAPATMLRHRTPAPFPSSPQATGPTTTNAPTPPPVAAPATTPSRSTPSPFPSPPPATSPTTTTPNIPMPPPFTAPATTPCHSTPTPFPSPPPAIGPTTTPNVTTFLHVAAPSETMPSQLAPSPSTPTLVPPSTFPQTRLPLKQAPVHKSGHQNETDGGAGNTTKGRGKGAVNASGGQPTSAVQGTYWTSSNPAGENPTITFPPLPLQEALSAWPKCDVQHKKYADGTTVPELASVLNSKRLHKALTSKEMGPSWGGVNSSHSMHDIGDVGIRDAVEAYVHINLGPRTRLKHCAMQVTPT